MRRNAGLRVRNSSLLRSLLQNQRFVLLSDLPFGMSLPAFGQHKLLSLHIVKLGKLRLSLFAGWLRPHQLRWSLRSCGMYPLPARPAPCNAWNPDGQRIIPVARNGIVAPFRHSMHMLFQGAHGQTTHSKSESCSPHSLPHIQLVGSMTVAAAGTYRCTFDTQAYFTQQVTRGWPTATQIALTLNACIAPINSWFWAIR